MKLKFLNAKPLSIVLSSMLVNYYCLKSKACMRLHTILWVNLRPYSIVCLFVQGFFFFGTPQWWCQKWQMAMHEITLTQLLYKISNFLAQTPIWTNIPTHWHLKALPVSFPPTYAAAWWGSTLVPLNNWHMTRHFSLKPQKASKAFSSLISESKLPPLSSFTLVHHCCLICLGVHIV